MPDRPQAPLDHLLDLVVFFPVGILSELCQRVPELTGRGRREIEQRIDNYRAVGQLVVTVAGQRGPAAVRVALDRAIESLRARNDDDRAPTPTMGPKPASAPGATTAGEASGDRTPGRDELPIDGYDALSAVQVLPRLVGLSAGELDLVERYERSQRARRTILSKIEQMRSRVVR